jgi:hypothetical protein
VPREVDDDAAFSRLVAEAEANNNSRNSISWSDGGGTVDTGIGAVGRVDTVTAILAWPGMIGLEVTTTDRRGVTGLAGAVGVGVTSAFKVLGISTSGSYSDNSVAEIASRLSSSTVYTGGSIRWIGAGTYGVRAVGCADMEAGLLEVDCTW